MTLRTLRTLRTLHGLLRVAAAALWLVPAAQAFRTSLTLKDFREQLEKSSAAGVERAVFARDVDPALLYPEHNLSVPVDHFHNDSRYEPHSDALFPLRYWFDASHYQLGGPVIVLQSGEADGEQRLPFLQKGIVAQLAAATGGLGVVLEHRYYGRSFPVPDLSVANLRFLTTDQALADMAYFARHAVFPGLEHLDLTAPRTPYIAYGGSYAGAFVAFLRILYPDVYWGAISSSGVTEAIYDYWQYYEAARRFGPPDCVSATQALTAVVDALLIGRRDTDDPARLRAAFGLANLTRSDDFAAAIAGGIAGLQGTNWDPAVNSTDFGLYCANVSAPTLLYPELEAQRGEVAGLLEAARGAVAAVEEGTGPGAFDDDDALVDRMLNYIGYVNATVVQPCLQRNRSLEQCYTNYNTTFYRQDDLSQTWRSWPYQYCTEWGYFQTGSGVPADQRPLISRLIDLPFSSVVCREAFNITAPPDVARVNRHGGFAIRYPRLAIVDGEHDPWRAATPHALGQPDRPNTASEPFYLIARGVHHWDENGLFANETTPELPPPSVAGAQALEVAAVREWMLEWKLHCMVDGGCAS